MGIVDRVKEDFYQRIVGEHVLVLSALDVDSLCACKILQALFKADNVQHTLVPVSGREALRSAFTEHADQVHTVVMLNCGGGLNILELLQPEDTVCFFVIDSHRPLELDNVYNQDQVNIVVREGEVVEAPDFDDIYVADEDSDGGYDDEYFSDEEGEPSAKRRRAEGESSYETRKRRHLWKRKREEILHKYYEFEYHGTAASLVAYELAWKMNRGSNELLWWAITGLTEMLLHEEVDREQYVSEMHRLQPEVLRHNRSDEEVPSSINTMKITFENELRLALYRHWTIFDSLCNSDYTACKLKVWTMKGHKKMLEFLAEIGLPLAQCKQKFAAMEVQYRENLTEWLDNSARNRKYGLDDMTYGSFQAQFGYKTRVCAADMLYATSALIESPEKSCSAAFFEALEALSRGSLAKLQEGLELAKLQQVAIVNQVRNFVDTHQVVCTGPFIYAYVDETTPNVKCFSKPMILCRLARFLRECWIASNKKARDRPFILSAPISVEEDTCLVAGVPPHSEDTCRSEFRRAFQQAADRIQARATFDHFDGSVFTMKMEDRGRFFDALTALSAF